MTETDLRARFRTSLSDRYAIEREVGRGGMATVYLARDVRHDRQVAVKVLDPELGAVLGAERFLAEIRVTANLQHPNLLPLFDSGEAAGLLFYVMPFVAGETLRARLAREKQLPVEEAVRIAAAVADALDHAHGHGVIHRDLKPENILLTAGHPGGTGVAQPLVADFGIALAVRNAGGQRVTQTGLSLGTPQYMSPEQATGDRSVDARTDVYSLAAVTYEMLTGEPPHVGATAQGIIAKLMTEEVRPLTVLRRSVPPHVDAAVRRALEKLPADRFASAGEFARALRGGGEVATPRAAAAWGAGPAPRRQRILSGIAGAAAAALAAGLAYALRGSAPAADAPVVRMRLDLPAGEHVMTGGFPVAVSPGGDRVAYVTDGISGIRTLTRRSSELASREVASVSLASYAFSPDGRWLAFRDGRSIRKVPAEGGGAVTIGSIPAEPAEIAWTSTGTLVVGSARGLWALPDGGGAARRITSDTAPAGSPVALSDGKTLLYVSRPTSWGDGDLVVGSLTSPGTVGIGIGDAVPLGVVEGALVYVTAGGALTAVPFDVGRRRVTGEPVQMETSVTGAGLSASGTLAYLPGKPVSRLVLASNARGEIPLVAEPRSYAMPRFSPDGRKIAVVVGGPSGYALAGDIWVYDLPARTFTRLTTDGRNGAPEWSPDGSRILFRTNRRGVRELFWRRADGGGEAELLYRPDDSIEINEALVSPDGGWLIYRTSPSTTPPRDIFAVPLRGEGSRRPVPLVSGPASEMMPRLSPDGRWLVYQSDESGRFEVYVRPFPEPGARVQVSDEGGTQPLWSRSGRELLYRTARGVVSVAVSAGATFAIGERRIVLTGDYQVDATHQDYDVSPDGGALLMVKSAEDVSRVIIVHNWGRELRERLASRAK